MHNHLVIVMAHKLDTLSNLFFELILKIEINNISM